MYRVIDPGTPPTASIVRYNRSAKKIGTITLRWAPRSKNSTDPPMFCLT